MLLAALGLGLGAASAEAQEHDVVFKVRSHDRYAVDLRFYSLSDHRRGWQWPGNGRIYEFRDSRVHDFPLRCYHHEYICYGAWVEGNPRRYWGLGRSGNEHCESCCWHCDNEQTWVITLTD